MRFLIDESVSRQVAATLRFAGHDAMHVGDIGLADAHDDAILERAHAERPIVVTQDADFGTQLVAKGTTHPTVILFRNRDGRPAVQSRLLLQALDRVGLDLPSGAIIVIGDANVRLRRLP